MDVEEHEEVKFSVRSGEKDGVFARGTSEGWVIGSRNPDHKKGCDDHLTLVVREGELKEVHRTVDNRKDWSRRAGTFDAELNKLLTEGSETLDTSELLSSPDTFIVSWARASIAMRLLEQIGGVGAWIIGHRFLKLEVARGGNREVITVRFDHARLEQSIHQYQRIVTPFLPLVSFVLRRVGMKMVKRAGSLLLTSPEELTQSGDVGFIISPSRIGILSPSAMSGKSKLSYLPLAAMVEKYEGIESSLPFGRLSDLGSLLKDGTEISMQRRRR